MFYLFDLQQCCIKNHLQRRGQDLASTGKRPLTLRDVSEASGVSEMTVSRVLRGRGDVSTTTRDRVLRAAKDLGYVPNRIAGALASQRVNLVAVIIPSMSNMVFPEVMMGINSVLENTDLQAVVGITDYIPEKEEKVLYQMLSWRPTGIIIAGLEHSDTSRKMLKNSGIPVVEIMDVDGKPIDGMVGISHRRAGRLMAQEIIAAGYRKIGFLGTQMPLDHRAQKRFDGLSEALKSSNLEIVGTEFYSGGSALAKGRDLTKLILEKHPNLDFIFYSNDMVGAGGLLHLLDCKRQIPEDIGLAGFNGLELLDGLPMKLATMDACRYEIGQKSAEIIATRLNKTNGSKGQVIELEPNFNRGETIRRNKD